MNRIAELRKQRGLSQVELAGKVGIAQNTLSQYETGIRMPTWQISQSLAALFGVSIGYLMGTESRIKMLTGIRNEVGRITARICGEVCHWPIVAESQAELDSHCAVCQPILDLSIMEEALKRSEGPIHD